MPVSELSARFCSGAPSSLSWFFVATEIDRWIESLTKPLLYVFVVRANLNLIVSLKCNESVIFADYMTSLIMHENRMRIYIKAIVKGNLWNRQKRSRFCPASASYDIFLRSISWTRGPAEKAKKMSRPSTWCIPSHAHLPRQRRLFLCHYTFSLFSSFFLSAPLTNVWET